MTGLPELPRTHAHSTRARRTSPWRSLAMSALATGVVLVATRVFGQSAPSAPSKSEPPTATTQPGSGDDKAKAESQGLPFLRVVENKGKSIELQIATRDYIKHDGSGPRIGLVAVAHIGDKAFYRALEKRLGEYDLVLYESVKPAGASKPGGDTPDQRTDSTRASMRFVGGVIESYKHEHDAYPADVEALKKFATERDARLTQFLSTALVDAWGRTLLYSVVPPADVADAEPTYALLSLGADGKAGGEGENADLDLAGEEPPDPTLLSNDDGLQSQLADALGLEFQLEAMDYSPANWRCSDMAMDELNRRLEAKGLDFEVLGGTLAGSSLPAKLIKILLGMMKMLDAVTDGAVTDMFKVVMIEMLGDPALIDLSMDQLGKGFGEVIIVDRNQVALDDLKAIIANERDVKSIAVFYGAGHMGPMVEQLREQLGYEPVDGSERWFTAMKVDLTKSAISQREITQIRMMIKQAIRQQLRSR